MKTQDLERIELINPRLTNDFSSYSSDGKTIRHRFVEYEFPAEITSAIGIGCSGRKMCVTEGSKPPAVLCERVNGLLIAVYWDN